MSKKEISKDCLGDRMKSRYEDAYRQYLPARLPVIVRVDGRAFHSLTRKFDKPFDRLFMEVMQETARELCENVAGCKLGYVESDEISLLITNNDTITTAPWFDNNLQKIVSVTASMATRVFNQKFTSLVSEYRQISLHAKEGFVDPGFEEHYEDYRNVLNRAEFDSRAFVIPEDEVTNYFIWRQQDATRNSIQMVARSLYSHKQLQNKNSKELQEMIFQKGQNWNDYPTDTRRGACVIKEPTVVFSSVANDDIIRNRWIIDTEIPVFTQDRNYIESRFKNLDKKEQ